MEPESLKHNQHLQMNLDKLRAQEGYDFGGIALCDCHYTSSPTKWQYISGNTNDRYKLIILRKGREFAGVVVKTGKRMVIADVDTALSPEEKVRFLITLSESLTAVVAVPLWLESSMYGALLLDQRNHRPLPQSLDQLNIEKQIGIFTEIS